MYHGGDIIEEITRPAMLCVSSIGRNLLVPDEGADVFRGEIQ